jgi:hypothetical protein
MSAEKLHSYTLPTGRRLVIREMRARQVMEISASSAGRAAANPAASLQSAMSASVSYQAEERRRLSLVQVGDRRVSETCSVADLLDDLSGPEMDCLDAAIARWADASPEVLRDFLASCDQEEESQETRVPRVVTRS